jgi:putative ABC transport system permease protein
MSIHGLLPHYLVTALRNLARHKLYSFINIAGLSVGLACAIFIALFLRDELSYDRWIPGSSNLYRMELTFHLADRPPWPLATAPFPVLRTLQEQIPEVTATTHLLPEPMTVMVGNRQFFEIVATVDPSFFQVVRLPLVAGDPASVLSQPESIVLSQSVARKYFGATDPLGKIVTVTGSGILCDRNDAACLSAAHPLTVTGVLRDLPANSQLAIDLLMPNTSQADELPKAFREQAWTSTNGVYNYAALAPGADPETVLTKLKPILARTVSTTQVNGVSVNELLQFHLTPFWDVHLTSDNYGGMNYGGMKPPGSRTTVYGFAIIALLIMVVACFNFMNLATARATLRAREISLRKTVGATRPQLIVQFLGEALMMALISLVVALALVEVLLPVYDAFLNRPISFNYLADWSFLLTILVAAIVAGLLSGVYPALVLSGFRPAAVLKASTSAQSGSGWMRMALVVSQFAVSIGLGIAAIVVFSQIHFARNIDMGFDRDGVVILRGISKLKATAADSLAHALRANPEVVDVALSNAVPFDLFNAGNIPIRSQGQSQSVTTQIITISPDFPALYGMRLLAGRLLSAAHGEDAFSSYPFFPQTPDVDAGHNVLINREAARRLGYSPEEAVGKTLVGGNGGHIIVAGVLGDSKLDGVRESVAPAAYGVSPNSYTLLSIRIHGARISETLAFIDQTWRAFVPGSAVQRYFLSDAFDNLLKSDERQGVMFTLFVGIAILISCLGLFGLAAFTAQRRTKEIGIRKVFGARTQDVVRLLLWQFSIPVLIANAIAWPIAYYYLHHWLESYAYRISLNPLYFIGAGATALAIAWATIFAHALRVARASPIFALRYE